MDSSWPADDLAGLISKLGLGSAPPGLPPPVLSNSPPEPSPSDVLGRTSSSSELPSALPAPALLGRAAAAGGGGGAAAAPPSLGWGGQAIPDTAHFKAPWFGKNRSRGGGRGRGSGRGRGGPDGGGAGGRRGAGRDGGPF